MQSSNLIQQTPYQGGKSVALKLQQGRMKGGGQATLGALLAKTSRFVEDSDMFTFFLLLSCYLETGFSRSNSNAAKLTMPYQSNISINN